MTDHEQTDPQETESVEKPAVVDAPSIPPAKAPAPVSGASPAPSMAATSGLARELSRVLLLGFGLVFAYRFAHHIVPILLMFAMVFLIAIILNSVVAALEKRGVRRGMAVAFIMLLLVGSMTLAGWLIVPPAVQQANTLMSKAPTYWKTIQSRAHELEEQYPVLQGILPELEEEKSSDKKDKKASPKTEKSAAESNDASSADDGRKSPVGATALKDADGQTEAPALENLLQGDALLGYAKRALAITTGLIGAVFVAVLSLLLLLFTLANPQSLVAGVLCAVPDDYREPTRRSMARIFMQMPGWARATFINGTITGVLTGVGLALVGVQPALVLGICAFFGEFVPNVGPLVMAAPALFVALSISPAKALAAMGVIVFVQAIASNALNPIIMGREMKLHPVTITFFALSMGAIFGVAGAILAVPTAAIAKIAFEEFYLYPRRVPEAEIQEQARAIVAGESGVEVPED